MKYNPDYLLIDASTFVFRAFHAMPSLVGRQGQPTGAIRGALNQFNKMEKDYPDSKLVVVFDPAGQTKRNEIYSEYKANRVSMPEDLSSQFELIKSIVVAKGWPMVVMKGEEADDVIGSLSVMLENKGFKSLLVSGDKDLTQLVNDNALFYNPNKFELDAKKVEEHYGVPPNLIPDYLALAGDTVDNIPGVAGVGDKTALALLQEFGSLDGIISAFKEDKLKINKRQQGSFEKSISSHQIYLWKDLTTIRINLDVSMEMIESKPEDSERLNKLYRNLGFREASSSGQKVKSNSNEIYWELQYHDDCAAFVKAVAQSIKSKKITHSGIFGIPEEPDDLLLGAAYLCIFFNSEESKTAHLIDLKSEITPEAINKVMLAMGKKTITPFWKQTARILAPFGLSVECGSDAELMSYVIKSNNRHDWEGLALQVALYSVRYSEMVGTGKRRSTFSDLADERRNQLLQAWLNTSIVAHDQLSLKLSENKPLLKLYTDVELPVAKILAKMEKSGIALDLSIMKKVDDEITKAITQLQQECYKLAGKDFAIDSLNNLRQILFHDLKMPVLGKTPKGQASTSEDVLRELAELGNKLPAVILEYRSMNRLKSTFTSKLPLMVNERTGKIHTQWQQTSVISGRIGSTNPNLQQIPVRTEMSRQIRKSFVAGKGNRLIKADYSQIELRVMAHYSKDPVLIKAFSQGDDIHKATASTIFDVGLKDVTPEMRQQAKAVNFGLIYGISAYGLARQLRVDVGQAKKYMDEYFEKLHRVADFMKRSPELGKKKGYVETLLKRRIALDDINHPQKNLREHAMRLAINAPLQGTSADITKLAMVNFSKAIAKENFDAELVMQVHDELVVEAKQEDAVKVARLLQKTMVESGKSVIKIPIVVDVGIGLNYLELEELSK